MDLTTKEIERIRVIEDLVAQRLTIAEAARKLHLSERQVKRLKKRYRPDTTSWIRHGNRGHSKPWRIADNIRERIVALARDKYPELNDSALLVQITNVENIKISRETLRRILRDAGIPVKKRDRAMQADILVTDQERQKKIC